MFKYLIKLLSVKRLLFLTTLIIAVGAVAFLILSSGDPSRPTQQSNSNDTANVASNDSSASQPTLYIGDENAKVKLIEYGDFKCPNCAKFHSTTASELRSTYVSKNDLAIEFRNYPFIGPDSGRAARGTYCAEKQAIFQQYHDAVFDHMWETYYKDGKYEAEFEDILTVDLLTSLVDSKLKDVEAFRSCLEDTALNTYIDADLLKGADDGINGTPGFVIGSQKIVGPQPFTVFKTLIEIELR